MFWGACEHSGFAICPQFAAALTELQTMSQQSFPFKYYIPCSKTKFAHACIRDTYFSHIKTSWNKEELSAL